MLRLAAKLLRHRAGSSVATLVALAAGVMILMTMGTLMESGLRFQPQPQRYGAADVIVARRTITFTTKQLGDVEKTTVPLPEGGTVPAGLVDRIRAVPGVATAVADYSIPVAATPVPALGHGWGSAALTPYRISAGRAPGAADEIVADARLGWRPGQPADLLVGGVAHRYQVSGVVEPVGATAAVFFTDARAAALTSHPGQADAIGVIAAPGADPAKAVGALAASAGAEVYTGNNRGQALTSDDATAATMLIAVGSSFGGYVLLLIVFVVAGTVGLSVRHRRRDLALLRAVAATPGQARSLIVLEAALLSVAGAVAGVPAAVVATRWTHDQLVARGFVPGSFPIVGGVIAGPAAVLATTVVAVLAALIAARRVTRIRPTEALGEIAVEPARSGRVRLGFGLFTLAAAAAGGVVTVAANGNASLAGAVGMLYLFVLAVGLLAPWINRTAARLLAPALRAVWGPSGYLATANLRANAQGMATVLTALVLSVGFGGSVWFLQNNLERQTIAQSRDGLLADHVLVSPAGLPATAAADIRRIPGVREATGSRRTSVIVKVFDGAETVGAQAIDGAGAGTLDLRVTEGSLADLHGASVAVSSLRAASQGWHVGDQADIWLGDGTPVSLRVVAIYQRGLGFGDLTLTRETVGGLDDQVLIRSAPGTALVAPYPGSRVVPAAETINQLSGDLALTAWLNKLLIGVMVGYAALAAANTMVMAALARGRELAQLRLIGVTRRQARRMIHAEQAGLLGVALVIGGTIAAVVLTAVVHALTGQLLPYVPPLGWAAVIGGTALLALATTVLPIGRMLRRPAIESIGLRE
jgi:putative ABC transport system permease protein